MFLEINGKAITTMMHKRGSLPLKEQLKKSSRGDEQGYQPNLLMWAETSGNRIEPIFRQKMNVNKTE